MHSHNDAVLVLILRPLGETRRRRRRAPSISMMVSREATIHRLIGAVRRVRRVKRRRALLRGINRAASCLCIRWQIIILVRVGRSSRLLARPCRTLFCRLVSTGPSIYSAWSTVMGGFRSMSLYRLIGRRGVSIVTCRVLTLLFFLLKLQGQCVGVIRISLFLRWLILRSSGMACVTARKRRGRCRRSS